MTRRKPQKKKGYVKPAIVKISKESVSTQTDCHSGGAPSAGSCWRGYDN